MFFTGRLVGRLGGLGPEVEVGKPCTNVRVTQRWTVFICCHASLGYEMGSNRGGLLRVERGCSDGLHDESCKTCSVFLGASKGEGGYTTVSHSLILILLK